MILTRGKYPTLLAPASSEVANDVMRSMLGLKAQFKNLRSRSRQIVVRFESDDDLSTTDATGYKWRLGTTRVDLQPSGRR